VTAPPRKYDIVTFDCYGTLIDWELGISQAFIEAAAQEGVQVDRRRVLEAHADIEPAVQAGPYRTYHDVLAETARRMAERLRWMPSGSTDFLSRSLPAWPAFPDTNAALARLAAAGYRLGILSNIDDGLLVTSLRHFKVKFDLIVTAQKLRSYKPAPAHFVETRERIGESSWLHAAQSYFHDVVPAREHGIPVAWINRNADKPSGKARPDHEFPNLKQLADHLT